MASKLTVGKLKEILSMVSDDATVHGWDDGSVIITTVDTPSHTEWISISDDGEIKSCDWTPHPLTDERMELIMARRNNNLIPTDDGKKYTIYKVRVMSR